MDDSDLNPFSPSRLQENAEETVPAQENKVLQAQSKQSQGDFDKMEQMMETRVQALEASETDALRMLEAHKSSVDTWLGSKTDEVTRLAIQCSETEVGEDALHNEVHMLTSSERLQSENTDNAC